jgi:DNA replication protein DnaC
LSVARADGSYASELGRISCFDVLVLDHFLIAPMKDTERRDLLEALEDRYGHSSTVITSQVPPKTWHERLAARCRWSASHLRIIPVDATLACSDSVSVGPDAPVRT